MKVSKGKVLTPADVAPKVVVKIPVPKLGGLKQTTKSVLVFDAAELPAVKAASE